MSSQLALFTVVLTPDTPKQLHVFVITALAASVNRHICHASNAEALDNVRLWAGSHATGREHLAVDIVTNRFVLDVKRFLLVSHAHGYLSWL